MAINRNSEVSEEIRDVFKLQQMADGIISNLAGQIIPVCDVNPKHSRIAISRNARYATSGTIRLIYQPETNKDFYLTSATLSIAKDAACDMASGQVTVSITQDGTSRSVLSQEQITLTALNSSQTINFSTPIKIDRGTTINIIHTAFTAGVFSVSSCISGFTIDNAKA